MDFSFSSDQELIRDSARRFVENECSKETVREMLRSEKGYDPGMWQKMADLGWMGLALPEEFGGVGGGMIDLALVLEEMGRGLLPGPFFSTVAACVFPILAFGTTKQKEQYLPSIAAGEAIGSLALTEGSGTSDPAGIGVEATAAEGGYLLNGTKLFVPYAHVADFLLVAARTNKGSDAIEGITLFLVDSKSPGIEIDLLPTLAGDKQCEVRFSQVSVPRENLLGELDRGWPVVELIHQRTALLKSAEMLGGVQAVLEMTIDYTKQRVQFGAPIGSFQAVQHNLVDLFNQMQGLRHLVYEASWRVDAGLPSLPAAPLISMAKAKANQIYEKTCIDGMKLHGAIGFTEELDIGLYHLRTRANLSLGGDTRFHLDRIAESWG
ncbi:MAG: acyl-CoA/acyl-ACP dehydrogenase [Deltaproteobacteria bacterium]|nr:acyl-CoA/acyl-ACP dehydrogenase [Deltaproteobacteria bacterium]